MRAPSVVYLSMAQPPLIAGVEPRLMVLNVGIGFIVTVMLKWWVLLAVIWVTHHALKALSKNDPFVRNIYIIYQRQANRYEPWPEAAPRRGLRPINFGRGIA
jgi:type IV secretory pathway VirB3-like protein